MKNDKNKHTSIETAVLKLYNLLVEEAKNLIDVINEQRR